MAQHIVLLINESVPQVQTPQGVDTYLMPADAEIQGNLVISGTVDGRDVAADGAITDLALIPGDNLSDLTNDIIATSGEAIAGADDTKIMTPLQVANVLADAGVGTTVKNNFTALVDPTGTNDDSDDYAVGSTWINKSTGEAFRCVDATTNLAVWVDTTVTASDLAAVAASGDSDDLTEGTTNLLMTQAERDALANLSTATTGITAYAGGGQANAVDLTTRYNIVETCATAGDSVKLPSVVGSSIVVVKNVGVASLDVFPVTGEEINKEGINGEVSIAVDTVIWFYPVSGTKWETL